MRLNRFKKRNAWKWPFEEELFFQKGLYGFEKIQHFSLIGNESEIPFLRLVAKEYRKISFLLIDPFVICPDYNPLPCRYDVKEDDATTGLFLLALVNSKKKEANLSAPLLINWEKKCGVQLLLPDEPDNFKLEEFMCQLFQQDA